MIMIPPKAAGGDQFSVNPETLRDTAPTYYHAAQDINTLQQTLVSSVQMAAGDMFLLLEFAQLASKLEQLQARIDAAMQCASIGLNRVGVALSIAADEYTEIDQEVSNTFTGIADDTNQSNLPPLILPGINIPGGNPDSALPTKSQSGVPNPLLGAPNTQQPIEPRPNPWLPFLPEI